MAGPGDHGRSEELRRAKRVTPLNPRFHQNRRGPRGPQDELPQRPFRRGSQPSRKSWLAPEASLRREELVRSNFILGTYSPLTRLSLRSIEMLWDRLPERHGISISRDEFIQVLRQLIGLGLLKAVYRDEYWQYDGMPPLEDIKPFRGVFLADERGLGFPRGHQILVAVRRG